jgi:hypothetical protein
MRSSSPNLRGARALHARDWPALLACMSSQLRTMPCRMGHDSSSWERLLAASPPTYTSLSCWAVENGSLRLNAGRPTRHGKTHFGVVSPAKPALTRPVPLSQTTTRLRGNSPAMTCRGRSFPRLDGHRSVVEALLNDGSGSARFRNLTVSEQPQVIACESGSGSVRSVPPLGFVCNRVSLPTVWLVPIVPARRRSPSLALPNHAASVEPPPPAKRASRNPDYVRASGRAGSGVGV